MTDTNEIAKAMREAAETALFSQGTQTDSVNASAVGLIAILNERDALKRERDAWRKRENEMQKALQTIGDAERRARIEELKEAREIVARQTETPDCDRARYDASCNAWECSIEIRGGDCICAVRIEQAEKLLAAIDARIAEVGG